MSAWSANANNLLFHFDITKSTRRVKHILQKTILTVFLLEVIVPSIQNDCLLKLTAQRIFTLGAAKLC